MLDTYLQRTHSVIVNEDDLKDRYIVSLKVIYISGGEFNISIVNLIPFVGKKLQK